MKAEYKVEVKIQEDGRWYVWYCENFLTYQQALEKEAKHKQAALWLLPDGITSSVNIMN